MITKKVVTAEAKGLRIAALATSGVAVLLLILTGILVVTTPPGAGANIGAGLTGIAGIVLLLVAIALAIGAYVSNRNTTKAG